MSDNLQKLKDYEGIELKPPTKLDKKWLGMEFTEDTPNGATFTVTGPDMSNCTITSGVIDIDGGSGASDGLYYVQEGEVLK